MLLVLAQRLVLQLFEAVGVLLLRLTAPFAAAPGLCERLRLLLKLPELWITVYLVFEVRGELVGEAVLVKLFHALEIFDMSVVALFVSESRLAIDGGTVGHVTLAKDSFIGLREVLRALYGSVPF